MLCGVTYLRQEGNAPRGSRLGEYHHIFAEAHRTTLEAVAIVSDRRQVVSLHFVAVPKAAHLVQITWLHARAIILATN